MRRQVLVAALLATVLSGCGADDTAAPTACDDTVPDGATELTVRGTTSLTFEPDELSADAGAVHITLVNGGPVPHTFVIDGTDLRLSTPSEGDTCAGVVTLEPGTWEFWCDVPGHREGGMKGVLTVE